MVLSVSVFLFCRCTKQKELTAQPDTAIQPANGKLQTASLTGSFFDNDSVWKDAANNPIAAQGGCIVKISSTYHWFGVEYQAGTTHFNAINHYTSTDLVTWTKQTAALTPNTDFPATKWVGRPYVMINNNAGVPAAQKYVMVVEKGDSSPATRNTYAFLTASAIGGPWTYQSAKTIGSLPNPVIGGTDAYTLGDLSAYSDGTTAWLLFTFDKGASNGAQGILKLGMDFMTPTSYTGTGNYKEFYSSDPNAWNLGFRREAACMINKGGTYYYFTSNTRGWSSSQTAYRTLTSSSATSGTWSAQSDLLSNYPAGNYTSVTSFNTQNDFMVPVAGSSATTYLYCGDRWSNFYDPGANPVDYLHNHNSTGLNDWFPLTFDTSTSPATPILNAPNYNNNLSGDGTGNGGDWILNLTTGEWGTPNLMFNPGFETGDFSNWTTTGGAQISTATAEVHSGTYGVKFFNASAYNGTLENSTLYCPSGSGDYTVKFWSRAGNTFTTRKAEVFVNGSLSQTLNIPLTSTWTQYAMTGITVTNGATVKIKITANSAGGGWTQFDDFELTRN